MLQLILRHPAVAPATGEALTPWTVKIVEVDFRDAYVFLFGLFLQIINWLI